MMSNWNSICLPPRRGVQLAGLEGLNMEMHRGELFNNALLRSLSTIQAAKTQFRLLTARSLTPSVLVSQIGLCEVLLGEIRAIRCSLEERMRYRGVIGRRSVLAKRNRSNRHLAVSQVNPSNRSKQMR
jgi:hypothetical protein